MEYVNPEETPFSYKGLYEMIEGRKTQPKEGSYTTYLFEKGMDKILKKVGEESTEVIIAGAKNDKEETIYEVADLAYHLMVMMVEQGITLQDVTAELCQAPCDRPQNQAGTDEIDPNQISSTRKIPSMDSIAARASWRLISLGSTTERLMAMEPFVTGEVWMI